MKVLPWMLLALAATGCREARVKDALTEMRGDKYARVVESGRHRLEVRFLPLLLQVLSRSELDGSRPLTRSLLDSLEKPVDGAAGITFTLRLEPRDTSSAIGFDNDVVYGSLSGFGSREEAMRAYLFGLKEKIWLEVEGLKIPLANYQMENSFGITRGRTFVLLFPELPPGLRGRRVELQLVLDDIVPGLARKKLTWKIPVGKYDQAS